MNCRDASELGTSDVISIDPQQIKAIFLKAVEQCEPGQWNAFLDEACGNDELLRRRVAALLEAHLGEDSLLEREDRAAARTVDQPPRAATGTQIGPYKLLQQIGEGGMGVVYMAEQLEPVRRKVALKIIKPGMDTRQVIVRFEAERQALSLMDHPNIARVLDAGTTASGRPFFVMELVKGQPITQYCDEKHLTPRQRLELLLPVCQAIQHAHQKGVIHRDIKPSNILVAEYDQKPVPKVIDFGVAKAISQPLTEKTMFTGFGQIVGTLEYMSREQAKVNQLDIDTRSDIYSLGVLMYELLTGTTPFDKQRLRSAAWDEMLRIIREEKPPKPSTRLSESKDSLPSVSAQRRTEPAKLTKLVRGELDWIVMRALEKDRDRRYETANGFAADIQRYLNDEPVIACPPSAAYRLRKFVRRNKSGLLAAAIAMLFIVALGSVLGWAVRDREARGAIAAREQQARRERLEARVNQVLDERRAEYERDDLPEAVARLSRIDALLDDGLEVGEELRQHVEQWRSELAILQKLEELGIADIFEDRDRQQLDTLYKQVFASIGIDIDESPAEESGRRIRSHLTWQRLTEVIDRWVWHRHQIAHNERDPMTDRDRLLQIARAADDDEVRNRIRLIVEKWDRAGAERLADSEEVSRIAISSLVHLSAVIYWGGGEPGREQSIKLLLNAHRQNPGSYRLNTVLQNYYSQMDPPRWADAAHHAALALAIRPTSEMAEFGLAFALGKLGKEKLDEAIAHYRRGLERNPRNIQARGNLGWSLRHRGNLEAAIAECDKIIELDPKYALAWTERGNAFYALRQFDKALADHTKAIELDPKFAYAWINRVNANIELGRFDEAFADLKRVADIAPWSNATGDNLAEVYTRNLAEAYNRRGAFLCDQRAKYEDALADFREALRLQPDLVAAQDNIGVVFGKQGKLSEAIAAHHKAIEINPNSAEAHLKLGIALKRQGNRDGALAAYRKAVEIDPNNVKAHFNLGNELLYGKRELEEAVACLRRAIELDANLAYAHESRGVAFEKQGQLDEAINCYRRASELDPKSALTQGNLGGVLFVKGQVDEAIACFSRALEIDPQYGRGHTDLGTALERRGQVDEALVCCRRASELNSEDPDSHVALGAALYFQGQYADARDATARALAILPENDPRRAVASRQRQACERLTKLEARLPTFLAGEDKSAAARESLDLVQICRARRMNAAAARFSAEAFAADPKLADNLQVQHRYNAACHAALAAAGQGIDAQALDDPAKATLRSQALDCLKADLTAWGKLLETGPPQARPTIVQTLSHWQKDPDLAGIRDAAAVAALHEDEQKACAQLWADVASLLKRVEEKPN